MQKLKHGNIKTETLTGFIIIYTTQCQNFYFTLKKGSSKNFPKSAAPMMDPILSCIS